MMEKVIWNIYIERKCLSKCCEENIFKSSLDPLLFITVQKTTRKFNNLDEKTFKAFIYHGDKKCLGTIIFNWLRGK